MGWLDSIFSSSKSTTSGRGQALTSTHEAFSLPTSSPGFSPRSHDRFGTPEPPDSSYTYPPPSSARGSYDFVPSPTAGRSRQQTSLLPMHNSSFPPSSQYPPLSHTWARLRAWLSAEYPELGDTLNYGILPAELAQIEMQMGGELPSAVRESYLLVDGQEPESSAGCSAGLFFGLTLMPLEDVLEEWRFWREVDDDPQTGANPRLREGMQSIPPGYVRREYSCRGWIPLITDKAGNYLGVDLNPGEGGAVGQVIVFGRDIDTKVVMWRGDGTGGWAKWLAAFVEDLESGEGYELGGEREGSDEEDDIGYESYFYDGHGRGHHGDGGGDTGTAGLKLAGEYRGWGVLDAWADRSIRRWYDAGVIPDASAATTNDEKGKGKMGLGVLDLAETTKTSDAEVPIPVLDSPTALEPTEVPQPRSPLPSISVTKPPAPKPFELPTEQDIYPGSPDDYLPDGDLEAGHGAFMQEAADVRPSPVETQTPRTPRYADPLEATTVPLPPSQATSPIHAVHDSASIPLADITDLLGDATPASTSHLPVLPEITIGEPPKVSSTADGEESPQSGHASDHGSSSEVPSSPTSGVSTEDFETVEAPAEMPAGR